MSDHPARSLKAFALRVILWFPICFAAWYFTSILTIVPLAKAINAVLPDVFPGFVDRVISFGKEILVVVQIGQPNELAAPAFGHEAALRVNAAKYGYCLPLYTALVLASPGEDVSKALKWVFGLSVLFFVQLFGISAEIMKDLVLGSEDARAALDIPRASYEIVALSYQLGFLILPSIAPLAIWVGQFRHILGDHFAITIPD